MYPSLKSLEIAENILELIDSFSVESFGENFFVESRTGSGNQYQCFFEGGSVYFDAL